jgi:hypothetical protein
MKAPVFDMMTLRQAALDSMADLPGSAVADQPFADIRVDLNDHLPHGVAVTAGSAVTDSLVRAVVARTVREGQPPAPGAALVTGLACHFTLEQARSFHEELFVAVWDQVRVSADQAGPADLYRIKVNITSDGAIPVEMYGSQWSFKQLHMDRDALLFSHLYGPATGFAGGELLLVDARTFLHRHGLRFADAFEWSVEPTAGSKPMLRAGRSHAALAECGINLGALGPDEVLFVNNFPTAGILHGVTPVEVTDRGDFVREFHRCSVKDLSNC